MLARIDTQIDAGQIALVPANVIVEVPQGYMLKLASRSSTPRKKGLHFPHGVGIIDQDYCGPEDEIMIQVRNFGEESVTVDRGEKIAQGIFVKVDQLEFQEVSEIKSESRGGFGSTDSK